MSPLELPLDQYAVLGSFPRIACLLCFLSGLGRSGGLPFRAMHSNCSTVPYLVPLLTLLALVELRCRFAKMS